MRFVCPELDTREDAWQDLLAVSSTNAESLAADGVNLPRVLTLSKTESGIKRTSYYYGASEMLASLFASRSFDGTARTIAEFAAACGADIAANFTDTADYAFWVRNLWEMKTNLWYTVFTDDGVAFYLPVRGESQLTGFTVIGETAREGIFEDMAVEGETGGSFSVSLDGKSVVPATVDDTQKNRIRNKYLSKNRRLTVESAQDVPVLTWLVHESRAYVILSRRVVTDGSKTRYRYEAVLEVNEGVSFAGADVTSVPDARLAESVFCRGLDFYLSADQLVSSGVWTKILFGTVRSGSPALLSSGSYVCPADGWYHVDIQTRFLYVNNTTSCYLAIYKNTASEVNTIERQFEASGSPYLHISLSLYCSAGDTLSGYVYHNYGSARNVQGGKGSSRMSVVRQGI